MSECVCVCVCVVREWRGGGNVGTLAWLVVEVNNRGK